MGVLGPLAQGQGEGFRNIIFFKVNVKIDTTRCALPVYYRQAKDFFQGYPTSEYKYYSMQLMHMQCACFTVIAQQFLHK